MKRQASAVWKGGLKDGRGTVSTSSGVLEKTAYSFSTRFEDGRGTNPEELIAAAHAAASAWRSRRSSVRRTSSGEHRHDRDPDHGQARGGWTVTAMHLDVTARVPGATAQAFEEQARAAKEGCPISRLPEREDHDAGAARELSRSGRPPR